MGADAIVALARPETSSLATTEHFCLFLSSIRRRIPRLHYALPVFAAFCRAEPISGGDLETLSVELDALHQALERSADDGWLRLNALGREAAPSLYRRSHYRGRTFDRTCVELVESDEELAFLAKRGLGPAAKHTEVYGALIERIRVALRMAQDKETCLQQVLRPHHTPPSATEF
jgi:hypothetical protein